MVLGNMVSFRGRAGLNTACLGWWPPRWPRLEMDISAGSPPVTGPRQWPASPWRNRFRDRAHRPHQATWPTSAEGFAAGEPGVAGARLRGTSSPRWHPLSSLLLRSSARGGPGSFRLLALMLGCSPVVPDRVRSDLLDPCCCSPLRRYSAGRHNCPCFRSVAAACHTAEAPGKDRVAIYVVYLALRHRWTDLPPRPRCRFTDVGENTNALTISIDRVHAQTTARGPRHRVHFEALQ